MPIYEYHCVSCDHYFELMQKVSDPLVKQCPKCSAEAVQKLVSAPMFKLEGSGWYETDYKKPTKPEKKTEAEGKEAKKPDPQPSSKKEVKDQP